MSFVIDDEYDYNAVGIKHAEIFTITIGIITTLFPLSVIVILIIRYKVLLKERVLVQNILLIGISDFFTNLAISWGFPLPASELCYTQAFMFVFFSRISWFYASSLVLPSRIYS